MSTDSNRNGLPSSTARLVERSSEELNIRVSYHESIEAFRQRYVRGDKLGGGGFGSVYRGSRIQDYSPAVIKEIDSRRVPCWCRLDGILIPLEVVLLTKVHQLPGVVKMLDVFNLEDNWIIVMSGNEESVCDMFDYICERGTLNETESAYLMYQLIGILLQCHTFGVLHRDLKDENLLIDRRTKEIQLIDFGSGAFLHEELYTDFDGTRVYCPPEWINESTYYGKPAEVWSVGVLLYDMLNGDVPFINDKGITSGRLKFRKDGLSEEVKNLMHACMNRDARMRPSLLQILHHPWMRKHRTTVGPNAPLSAQFALTEATMAAAAASSPLTSSVSYRSGLSDLVHDSRRHTVPESTPPSSASSTSCTPIRYLANGFPSAFRQPIPPPTFPDAQLFRDSVGHQQQHSQHHHQQPQEECQLSELMMRAHSNGSCASSGYYTRSNSLCFEEDRRRIGNGVAFTQAGSQNSQPVLSTSSSEYQQWREKTNTGSSSSECSVRSDCRLPPTSESSTTSPDFHFSGNLSCNNLRCLDYLDSTSSSSTFHPKPISFDEGLPPNIFDGITITVPRQLGGDAS